MPEEQNIDKVKILIVDDSSTIRLALAKQLEQAGANVIAAEDGQDGLDRALAEPFDLIVTDIDMPRMTGFELCCQLKRNPATRSIPVVILSSRDQDKDIEHGFQVGAAAYVTKTNARNELHEVVHDVMRKSSIFRNQLVLVVDDSIYIRTVVEEGLLRSGFQVLTANNGNEAMRVIKDKRPDLVLFDLNMPKISGEQLCRLLHAHPSLRSIPLVVMSSNSDRAVMRRMLQTGAAAFLVKPFNIEQMVITVEKLLADQFRLLLKEKEQAEAERAHMLASITSLVQALEARDQYTRGHSDSVASIAVNIARVMNFSEHDLTRLEIAGRLHDIGKIGIRDNVLLKPDRLNDEEYAIIKTHPAKGAEILRPISSMADIMPAVLHHHERIDGKGYPDGLRGSAIPLWARIIAVADCFDALTSDRPYRKGMECAKAMDILHENSGAQLCPECVEAFVSIIEQDNQGALPANSPVADNPTTQSLTKN